ncbi:hypothetical protein AVEN_207571-1 [Araneus ventricosus]|uniref:Uncharacterized protein n=1 Tax=Araneus ventricosus TaxID=182803 RepID=A0A4Y2UQB9_ARAVE|nr:hypothetical protein AVEN_207571-1 [Araneus ventricosus]
MDTHHNLEEDYSTHSSRLRGTWTSIGKVLTSGQRIPGLKPDSTENTPFMWACCALNHTQWPNVLPLVWCGSLERRMPAHVPFSSSDRSSKLRGPSQNLPRVASKRDVYITKLN